MQKYIPSLLF